MKGLVDTILFTHLMNKLLTMTQKLKEHTKNIANNIASNYFITNNVSISSSVFKTDKYSKT